MGGQLIDVLLWAKINWKGCFIKMMKRICLSILIAIFGVFAGAALVGFDLIPASVGLSVWGLGFIAAVAYFIRSGSKS